MLWFIAFDLGLVDRDDVSLIKVGDGVLCARLFRTRCYVDTLALAWSQTPASDFVAAR